MQRKWITKAGLVAAAAALALPASAAAESLATGVNAARAHTNRADAALDRAVRLWNRNSDRAAQRQFGQSRRELARAEANARRVERRANSDRERTVAAWVQRLVAEQRDDNVEVLTAALEEAQGRVERRVAQAALADTYGREKAMAVLDALLEEGVVARAETGVALALAALSQERGGEVARQAKALGSEEVSKASKRKVARTAAVNVKGQARAGGRLAELIADPDMPESSKAGLQRALDSVGKEQQAASATLSSVLDRLPAFVRSFVKAVVEQAHEDAQSMRENRPEPPTGGPGEGEAPSEEAPEGESPSQGSSEGSSAGEESAGEEAGGGAPESPGSGYRP